MPFATERLAQFALGLRYEDLTDATVSAVKRVILDTLGCALGAVGCEPARIAARLYAPGLELSMERSQPVTIIGLAAPGTLKQAILVNGVLNRYLDYGDVYWKRDVPHPSELVTVALAAVEAQGGSGRDFITAVLAGYEAQLRLCDAYSFQAIGMHAASAGGFIAPLVIGRAWGMNPQHLAHAVALNGVRHLVLFGMAKGELSMAKAIAFPLAAVEAVDACRLASEGFTGPLPIMEWLFENLPVGLEEPGNPQIDLAPERWRAEAVTLKRYPVQFEIQGAVEAALKVAAALPGPALDTVSEVTVTVNPITKERTADPRKYRPATRETADHSLPCCVAMALQDRTLGVEHFESDRWAADDIARLMARIKVVGDEALDASYPGGRPCHLKVRLNEGGELTALVELPLGDAKRPMSRQDIECKFAELASHVISQLGRRDIVAAVDRLDEIDRITELTALLKP